MYICYIEQKILVLPFEIKLFRPIPYKSKQLYFKMQYQSFFA